MSDFARNIRPTREVSVECPGPGPGPGPDPDPRAVRDVLRGRIHPGVTSVLLGARTMAQLDDLLAGLDTVLSDEILDRIDEIVPPGTDIGTLDQAYVPLAIQTTGRRRRPLSERAAA